MSINKYYSSEETLEFILRQFSKLRKAQGIKYNHKKYPKIILDGVLIDNIHALLFSEIKLHPRLGKNESQSLIKESVFEYINQYGTNVDIENYIDIIKKFESESLKKESKKYIFYSSLSSIPDNLETYRFSNRWGKFRTLKGWPRRIKKSKNWKFAVLSAGYDPPDDFVVIKIFTNDINLYDAANKAWKCVDLERAFWNFDLNILREQILSDGVKPFNNIFWGPVSFTEYQEKLIYFYDTSYRGSFTSNDTDTSKFDFKSFKNAKEKYKNHFDKQFIDKALIKYTNVFDITDKNTALTKLWELLEFLLCQKKSENYNALIDRCCKLFENDQVIRLTLEHIRIARNEYIHASNDINPNSLKTLYMLKSIVEMILIFHFDYGDRFETLSEYRNFLDLPKNNLLEEEKKLKSKIQLLEKKKKIPGLSTKLVWRK